MKYIIDTDTQTVLGPFENLEKPAKVMETSFSTIIDNTAHMKSYETGLLPVSTSGLLSYRSRDGYEQIIIQLEPAITSVKWGQSESTRDKTIYSLAMPYKIIVGDFEHGVFLGARHFFSMTPAYSWETQLYATGFSNTNNIGYRNTSIGWICLYHGDTSKIVTLAEKIDYIVWRESGLAEPYNYGNMSMTDGPCFYKKYMLKKNHFHSADEWQKKTKAEGMDWVFDPTNYIPYYADISPKAFAATYVDPKTAKATAYTLRHASYSNYAPYYGRTEEKPINTFVKNKELDAVMNLLKAAPKAKMVDFAGFGSPKVTKAKAPKLTTMALNQKNILEQKICLCCKKSFPHQTKFTSVITDFYDNLPYQDQEWCSQCVMTASIKMPLLDGSLYSVSTYVLYYSEHFDTYCLPWETIECNNCGETYPTNVKLDNVLIYASEYENVHQHYYCITCTDHQEDLELDYFKDPILGKYFISGKAKFINYLQLAPQAGSDQPVLAIKPTLMHETHLGHICNCGLYNEKMEDLVYVLDEETKQQLLICQTCTKNELITLEAITPVIVNQKEKI